MISTRLAALVMAAVCVTPPTVLNAHAPHGRHWRHRHHERRFYEGRHPGRDHALHAGHSGHANYMVSQNHALDNYIQRNDVTEPPRKIMRPNFGGAGAGSRWALSYQGGGLEHSAVNNTVSNVTAQLGGTAFLPCRVGHLGDRQISWIRRRDWHVLTSADVLFTHDHRFSVLHVAGSQDWTLYIRYVEVKDTGTYECQVSTGTGIISLFVNLKVVTPEAHIPGDGQYHVNRGSPITLSCVIDKSPTPPQYVLWYHNDELLNYARGRPEVQIGEVTSDRDRAVSTLEVHSARDFHSGNYTCTAPNIRPASTLVFVTEGDKTAAVQRIDSGKDRLQGTVITTLCAVLLHLVAVR
ncbi:hemicentin-1-like [Eriocheir sinensis]|uniref:hemicentin-1-like n=1 Tax=Eriocheir sinensis TaxID=95602 RepID=UPI0021C62655|nr:hemicentin-1-like [Eriocheir sinensis]